MKILSISDVITNSSSEVFIIHAKPGFQDEINDEIPELLRNLCESIELNIDDIMYSEIASNSEIDRDWSFNIEKNDLLIYSSSDNSIPSWLMEFIEELWCFEKFRNKFSGYYAEDLGEKEIPYYSWNTQEYKVKKQKIESIQRCHLG